MCLRVVPAPPPGTFLANVACTARPKKCRFMLRGGTDSATFFLKGVISEGIDVQGAPILLCSLRQSPSGVSGTR